jgi:hypothetical protein
MKMQLFFFFGKRNVLLKRNLILFFDQTKKGETIKMEMACFESNNLRLFYPIEMQFSLFLFLIFQDFVKMQIQSKCNSFFGERNVLMKRNREKKSNLFLTKQKREAIKI